ncbi:MAG: transporter substrate-binding domain-containing protein [Bifidobacteriaceae bacterium]|nr:transporter substrate-binding domain-containing protein [Bifidobacteriaceae bacterium]
MRRSRRAQLALTAVLLAALTGCSEPGEEIYLEPKTDIVPSYDTAVAATLTIATGKDQHEPWVEGDPGSCEGFEAAVACAVAERLGYKRSELAWTTISFDAGLDPGTAQEKGWDFALQRYSITAQRRAVVDFSTPYYSTAKGVLTYMGSPADGATSIEQLKQVRFGVQQGTTSAQVVREVIQPDTTITVFDNSEALTEALSNQEIEALVVDLPQAVYLANSGAVLGGVVVGQLSPSSGAKRENLAIVLPKDSPLTSAVSAAVTDMSRDGTLDELANAWLADYLDAPVLG